MNLTPFHIAVPVRDIPEARHFYGTVLGFQEGRSDSSWIDYNMFGHQFVCHLNVYIGKKGKVKLHYNPVDRHQVPIPHTGVVLDMNTWKEFSKFLKNKNIEFIIEPYIRFQGQPGEQATMFFLDPSGNALEFKAFNDIEAELFKKR